MSTWPVQDTQARFSELLDACVCEGPQIVAPGGAETAVLVAIAEWKRVGDAARRSLKELLLSACGRANLALPKRGRLNERRISIADAENTCRYACECSEICRPS